MKKGIHPATKPVTFSCECGNTFVIESTYKNDEFKMEVCSNCHPFYTGKQKIIDTSGRIEKFKKQIENAKAAQAEKEKKVKKIEE